VAALDADQPALDHTKCVEVKGFTRTRISKVHKRGSRFPIRVKLKVRQHVRTPPCHLRQVQNTRQLCSGHHNGYEKQQQQTDALTDRITVGGHDNKNTTEPACAAQQVTAVAQQHSRSFTAAQQVTAGATWQERATRQIVSVALW
jgi:hypothetical protein